MINKKIQKMSMTRIARKLLLKQKKQWVGMEKENNGKITCSNDIRKLAEIDTELIWKYCQPRVRDYQRWKKFPN